MSFAQLESMAGVPVAFRVGTDAPGVAVGLFYAAGSRWENEQEHGAAHFVEHLLFKGTKKFPAKILDKSISRDGGRWNAATSRDATHYYETMPAGKFDLALQLESDRMKNSAFNAKDVASERTVIISEREGSENEPLFQLSEAVQQTAFRVHPYHHEVIGDKADLQTITRDDLYEHYRRYYVPNNAVLSVAGDFDTKPMVSRIRELFEPIPKGAVPLRLARPEPEQKGEARFTIEGSGETTFIQAAYRYPNATHADFFPLQVFDSILGGMSGLSTKTSRLYRALVDKEFAIEVSGWAEPTVDPHLYRITLIKHPRRKNEEVIAAMDAEIRKLQDAPPPADELKRAVKQARAVFVYGNESITSQAFWMGYAEMFASYEWYTTYLDSLAKITPQDVQRVARQYFQPSSRVIGIYQPKGS